MKIKYQYLLAIILLLTLVGNIAKVESSIVTFYYSPEFEEGMLLEWEKEVSHIFPEPSEITLYNYKVTILQDISNMTFDSNDIYKYFSIEKDGGALSSSVVNTTLAEFLYPIVIVILLTDYPLYEYFQKLKEDVYPFIQSERKLGNIIVTNNLTFQDGFQYSETKIHEDTGIVRNSYRHVVIDDQEYTIKIDYLGGLKLVEGEFSIVIIVLLTIPVIQLRNQRKKKEKPTSFN